MTGAKDKENKAVLGVLDKLLARAAAATETLQNLEEVLEGELAAVRTKYEGPIQGWRAELDSLDKAIKEMAKDYQDVIFDIAQTESWVRLRHGSLVRAIERRIKRARGVLERLEALGRTDVVKIAKSVDWGRLEQWSDADLASVGTERVERVRYGYTLNLSDRARRHEEKKAAGKGPYLEETAGS